MKYNRIFLCFAVAAFLSFMSACGQSDHSTQQESPETKKQEMEEQEAETDCRTAMELIEDIYRSSGAKDETSAGISRETAGKMLERLGETGRVAGAEGFYLNMKNHEKMDAFLQHALAQKSGELVVYDVHKDGGIGRRKFLNDESGMYVLTTTMSWSADNSAISKSTSYNQVKEWSYTDKGWFLFEYYAPEPPEVSEIVNSNTMMRIKPMNEEYLEIAEKYLKPLGYQGNNLLCSNWDTGHLEQIDYNGLYQYLYAMKHEVQITAAQYVNGIPEDEFESLIMEYLPVEEEQLKEYAAYDSENKTYEWLQIGCGNYAPNAFGTSLPEITDIQEMPDGTLLLSVDAVCELLGSDAVMNHQVAVQFTKDGAIRYLGNQILNDGLDRIPDYQYRFTE